MLLWAGDFAAVLAAVSEERCPPSAEGPPQDGHPVPWLACPPRRGGWKMPVKKKRKSYGVAVAVAEDGGLKKCKISSYCRSQPPARLVRGEEIFQERSAWLGFMSMQVPMKL
jgi:hypothetical protein